MFKNTLLKLIIYLLGVVSTLLVMFIFRKWVAALLIWLVLRKSIV